MKFKIISIDRNKKQVIHYYDNITQCIQSERKIPIYLDNDPRCKSMVKSFKNRIGTIKKDLGELRIQLGLNCNFSCKYCNQRHGSQLNKTVSTVQLPIEVRVNRFIDKIKKSGITTKTIALQGGEPFVYWKTMQLLVPKLRELFPNQSIHLITNGSLIDEEKIDFCVKHRIGITVSHDAQAFEKLRNDKNPFESPTIINALKRYIKHTKEIKEIFFGINVVVNPYNADLSKIDEYFTKYFGEQVNQHFESIVKLDDESSKFIPKFDEVHKQLLLNNMFILGSSEPETAVSDLRRRVSYLLEELINRRNAYDKPYPCNVADDNVLATTLDGELLACHGASIHKYKIGDLDNYLSVKNTKVIPQTERNNCAECPFVIMCGGGCAIATNEDSEAGCENFKLWYSGLFIPAQFILFSTVIQKIEPLSAEECEGLDDY